MNSRILKNRSTFGFYSPQNKNSININEVEILKDRILKLKIELNKKNYECQELRIMYNRLDKTYKSNIILLEKLLNEANNNIINTNLSYDKENEKEKLEDIKKSKSPKIESRKIESNKNNKNLNYNNSFLNFANKNHLNMKLMQEIAELKKEINEKDNIINNFKNNATISKYKELDKRFSKMYKELIQTRENNEKLEFFCLNTNYKINNYKEKIRKLNNKNSKLEDENIALKKKLNKVENNEININDNDKIQKKNYLSKNEDIEKLKDTINILEKENKELKQKLIKKDNFQSNLEKINE